MYSKNLLSYFYNANHAGILNADSAVVFSNFSRNPSSPDAVIFYLILNKAEHKTSADYCSTEKFINKVSYQAYAGPVVIAAAEYIARNMTGASLESALNPGLINDVKAEFSLSNLWLPNLRMVCNAWENTCQIESCVIN